ncbi:molybdenum cofactor guanylyltransferase [Mycobacterium sp.]|uniref:molybdenum cofactor guanylyltransferase n=1 Tax=Mycobacterium sp. TaxID=1785 RepID=UPI003D120F6E
MTAVGKPASLAGVVVAAGASPWEGRVKALKQAPDGHTTAVEHVVSVLGQRCQPIFVVTSPGQSLPELSAQVVRDDLRGGGQLSAIGRGLRAAADSGAEYAFLASVDSTVLSADVIDLLAARAAQGDADIVLPWDGSNHYLAAVYRTELAAVVDDLVAEGARGIPALVARVDSQRVLIGDSGAPVEATSASARRSLLNTAR